jgi:hypothetical protein
LKANRQLRQEGFQILWEVNGFKLSAELFDDARMGYYSYSDDRLKLSAREGLTSLARESVWKTESIRGALVLDGPKLISPALSHRDLPSATWRANIRRLIVHFKSEDALLVGVEILPYLGFAKLDSTTVILPRWRRRDIREKWKTVIGGLRGLKRLVKHVEIAGLDGEDRESLEEAVMRME